MSKSYVGMLGCPRCGKPTGVILDRRMRERFEDGETYTGDELCAECEAEKKNFEQVVSEGGIYFVCDECEQEGVVVLSDRTRPLIEHVRRKSFPDMNDAEWMSKPCGVKFAKCYMHSTGVWPEGKD